VRRDVVRHLQGAYGVGERRACQATGFHRSSQRYRSRRDPQTELRIRLRDLAASRIRYGYRRLHILLRREGWPVNAKRVWRLYTEEGLTIRARLPRRKRTWRHRVGRPRAVAPNEVWVDGLRLRPAFDGRPIRVLAVLNRSFHC
jgi:putative transposase